MDNNYSNLANTDEYALSFSEEVNSGIAEKIRSVFSNADNDTKAFAANVLIGNVPAKNVNDSVGETFTLCGYYVKDTTFRDSERKGKYTVLLGRNDNQPCAYATSSSKVYEAVMKIVAVYGEPSAWSSGIGVKIRMNTSDNVKAYSLEVLG